ncbi:MAG: 2-amino-4-hydroxy-6-hydroxymethyldihydropteridine diphosphokinase [Ignavibacteria bacterium]|nr:2-amino-4-hydroxy-6-hydroxymethyldihydropteridine diphosphokinase [Ignavibacteria bacterium]
MKSEAFLSIGSNAGNRFLNVLKSILQLGLSTQIQIVKTSSIYKTEPYGYKEQKEFLNLVVKVNTNLEPIVFIEELKKIESNIGRIQREQWHEREIDIDILFYNNSIINSGSLKIPHPDLQNRRFVLEPFCEIEDKYYHPVIGKSIQDLLYELKDNLKVERLT